MDRHWLLTWTTYGTWLPGDRRGFVGRSRDETGRQTWHNMPGTPTLPSNGRLKRAARGLMAGPPVWLDRSKAGIALADFRETADVHGWGLLAAAIMSNHVHLVAG